MLSRSFWIKLAALMISMAAPPSRAQETVSVSAPQFVSFHVANVNQTTTASPSSATVSFSNAQLDPGMRLSISVMGDGADFSPPSGPSIPASKVTWTTSGAAGGSAFSGTLSGLDYTEVFVSNADPVSGGVDITFRLDAAGSTIRAGEHGLTLHWKFASVP